MPESSGVDLARVALRAAKEQAKARGDGRAAEEAGPRGGGLRSGARADGRDPMPLGAAINRLISERGWEAPAAVGGVMGRWPQIVGEDLANHCVPESLRRGRARCSTVQCDSTAWATAAAAARAPAGGPHQRGPRPRHGPAASRCWARAGRRSATAGCARRGARGPATPTGERPRPAPPLRARPAECCRRHGRSVCLAHACDVRKRGSGGLWDRCGHEASLTVVGG